MGDKPIWEQIGSSFVQHYYQLFDADRTQLGAIYIDASCLTWEGQQFQGKAAIVEKLSSLPFQKIQHSITAQDHQPTPDSCILSMVVGQLKADDHQVLGFHQSFLLKSSQGAWVCTNEVFRLALHSVLPSALPLFRAVLVDPELCERGGSSPRAKALRAAVQLGLAEMEETYTKATKGGNIFFPEADEDPIMGFHQIFLLKNINDAWVCTNDMFRLALHNFG